MNRECRTCGHERIDHFKGKSCSRSCGCKGFQGKPRKGKSKSVFTMSGGAFETNRRKH